VVIRYDVINGYMDNVSVNDIGKFEKNFYQLYGSLSPMGLQAIAISKNISIEAEQELKQALQEYMKGTTKRYTRGGRQQLARGKQNGGYT
jgi:F0F1-type ATP synthase alpha subunit